MLQQAKLELDQKTQDLDERIRRFEEMKEAMEKYPIEEDIIELNVGGRYFATYRNTLVAQENTLLEAMFSGRHPMKVDKKGRYFIDRNGDLFQIVLDYLRTGKLIWPSDPQQKEQLKLELIYYGLLPDPIVVTDSVILKDQKEVQNQLLEWLQEDDINVHEWQLLYRGSENGFSKSESGQPMKLSSHSISCSHSYGPVFSNVVLSKDILFRI